MPIRKRLKELEKESGRLRKAMSDLRLGELILKETASGNFFQLRSESGLSEGRTNEAGAVHGRAGHARRSLDFVHDQFACGRRFRVLNIVDDVTREGLASIPDTSISGRLVARELNDLISGLPA